MNEGLCYIVSINYNSFEWTIKFLNSLNYSSYKNFKILLIDNGSFDDSLDNITTFLYKRKFSYNMIDAEDLKHYFNKELDSDILITFDADGQHRIEDINSVVKPIKDKVADIVIGSRFLDKKSKEMPNYRKLGIKLITKITNMSVKEKLTDSQSGFRAYSKKTLEKITPSDEGMGVSTEILIKSSNLGLVIAEVPIKINYGGDTSTHDPVSHGTSVILSTLKFTSIHNPLKFYGIPGIIFLILGLGFTAWTIQIYSVEQQIITNISLIGIGCIVLGAILLMTAVILFSLVTVVKEK